jgi:hypothetical protein
MNEFCFTVIIKIPSLWGSVVLEPLSVALPEPPADLATVQKT